MDGMRESVLEFIENIGLDAANVHSVYMKTGEIHVAYTARSGLPHETLFYS